MRARERHDPTTIGRYRVLARISAGGVAMLYFARSPSGRAVAVKALHTEFTADPAYRERFRREVELNRQAGGRYSPALLDADPDAAVPWLALEFVAAPTLREAGILPVGVIRSLALGLLEALAAVHRAGVLHLDVKPANVLLAADGVRLVDFGIAARSRDGAAHLGGVPAGSPGYVAPEQAAGGWVSAASDVFALGATLSYACTGQPRPAGLGDDELDALLARCLRADPAERPTVAGLLTALSAAGPADQQWQAHPGIGEGITRRAAEAENPPTAVPSPGPRRPTVLLGGCALLVAVLVAVLAVLPPREVSGTAQAGPARSGTGQVAVPSSAAPATRTLEFYVFGDAKLLRLSISVNGEVTTLRDVRLPYRRLVRVPVELNGTSYGLSCRHGPGQIQYRILLDGTEYGTGGSSANSTDTNCSPIHGRV